MRSKKQIVGPTLVSQAEIEATGVRPRKGAAPLERGVDLLKRYLLVPNRMMILYSSEDVLLSDYIRDHWAALDELSGDVCEIYQSLLQLAGGEDVYSYLKDLRNIPGADTVRIDKLPMILLWSNQAAISISLSEHADEFARLKGAIRGIFQYLCEINRGFEVRDKARLGKMLKEVLNKKAKFSSFSVVIDRRVTMKADRGGVVVNRSKVRDIETKYTSKKKTEPIDLKTLAVQLEELRVAMKGEGKSTAHDIATGQIAAAKEAADNKDQKGTVSALKSAGKWALGVAQKIGVTVASKAIEDAMKGGGGTTI